MLTVDYFQTLKRAHDHPKQAKVRFTPEQKVEMLWKLVKHDGKVESLNKSLGLVWGSLNLFNKQLKDGDLGLGNHDLIVALSKRISRIRSNQGKKGVAA